MPQLTSTDKQSNGAIDKIKQGSLNSIKRVWIRWIEQRDKILLNQCKNPQAI